MRKAIIDKLKEITEFGNRVYQPLATPENTAKPFCVVKIGTNNRDFTNKCGSIIGVYVDIYEAIGKATSLDSLEMQVRVKLHNVVLSTDDSPARHFIPEFSQTLSDLKDDTLGLIFKRLDFRIAGARA